MTHVHPTVHQILFCMFFLLLPPSFLSADTNEEKVIFVLTHAIIKIKKGIIPYGVREGE